MISPSLNSFPIEPKLPHMLLAEARDLGMKRRKDQEICKLLHHSIIDLLILGRELLGALTELLLAKKKNIRK